MKKHFGIFLGGLLAGVLLTYALAFNTKERQEPPVLASEPTTNTQIGNIDDNANTAKDNQPPVQNKDLLTKYDELLKEYGRINSYLLPEDLPLKIVSKKAGSRNEIVVYTTLSPREKDLERKMYVLRLVNQVVRDNRDVERISIWENETFAQRYVKGDYDNSKTITGWEGFDHRAAFVVKDQNGINVNYALGRDDFVNISFGMRIPEF
ncbi:MAG: hypothetical protein H0Z34_12520 [Brevibacillus sp.]|nr:hypothetical protein [Brevibacillus sp.]